jgi:hypothetical protein
MGHGSNDVDGGASGINFFIGIASLVAFIVGILCPSALAQQPTEDLAAAAQSPIAAMYSLPFQNNTYFGVGPSHNQTANVLNIQPVLPFTFGDLDIISRTIAPLIYLPTATAKPLGSGKFSIGPIVVGLVMPKPWVIGILARQLWSVAGPSDRSSVSQLLLQPFVNYNLAEGWYLTGSPIITLNWNVTPGNRWNFPMGGGIGKIFRGTVNLAACRLRSRVEMGSRVG